MANAKEDFLGEVKGKAVSCALVQHEVSYDEKISYVLSTGYSENEYQLFLKSLDFSYDDGFGGQEVYGDIWYKDGTWSERGEYDGSEWWEHKTCPEIPVECAPTAKEES